jgi:ubiquinone biosynthesis protein UbiJ
MPSDSDRARAVLLDDLEEALSRALGDVVAHRLVGAAREAAALGRDAGGRLLEGLVEYALEEKRLVVPRTELDALTEATRELLERLEALEQRIERAGWSR